MVSVSFSWLGPAEWLWLGHAFVLSLLFLRIKIRLQHLCLMFTAYDSFELWASVRNMHLDWSKKLTIEALVYQHGIDGFLAFLCSNMKDSFL